MRIDKVYVLLIMVVIFSVLLWVSSCRHDAIIPANMPEICFDNQVLPIFINNCNITGCHDGRRGSLSSFNDYASVSNGVVAGDPGGSNLYQAIVGKSGDNRMPPDIPLSLENRIIIRIWIEQGAKQTICSDTTTQPPVTPPSYNSRACFSRDILPILLSSCGMTACHDAVSHRSGYNFTTYTSTLSAVRAGNPNNSILYTSITGSGEDPMPPSPKPRLIKAQVDSIAAWIRYGALNETCGEVCDTINPVTFSGVIWPTIQSTCAGCHSGTAPSGGILLTSYANVQTIAASGLLMKSLNGAGVIKMPPSGSLTSCKIRQFQIWINNGYKNN